jgi:cytochrome c oxidase subunit 4
MTDTHASHGRTYLTIFVILCCLTVISVIADEVQVADRRVVLAIVAAIAMAKSTCVVLYFMHLKFERGWKYLLLGPTLVLAASVPFALAADLTFHYYALDVPQEREIERLEATAPSSGHVVTPH